MRFRVRLLPLIPSIFFFILISLSLIKPSTSYANNGKLFHISYFNSFPSGYDFRDLMGDEQCFMTELSSWSANNQKTTTLYTICSGNFLVGGYGVLGVLATGASPGDYFKRTYSGLPAHNSIFFSLTMYAIDSWNIYAGLNEYWQLYFDTSVINGPLFLQTGFPLVSQCGLNSGLSNGKDLGPVRVFGRLTHTLLTLDFRIISQLKLDSYYNSFAFRDINLLFSTAAAATVSCFKAPIGFAGECVCQEGYFYDLAGAFCSPCHDNCKSCFALGANSCYQCAAGASFSGSQCYRCDPSCDLCTGPLPTQCRTCQKGLFLYQTNRCIPECPPPFTQSTDGCSNFCAAPTCTPTQFLDWTNTCINACNFPLQQMTDSIGTVRCIFPCESGDYLYWDGSCQTSCASPLTASATAPLYCTYSCSASQYLYWDGSCQATCNPYLVQRFERNKQFCDYPCSSSEYLYYDGACLPYCNSPFVPGLVFTNKICGHPCPSPSNFIYWDNTCHVSCPLPLIETITTRINYCKKPCIGGYVYWDGTCITSCPVPYRQVIQTYGTDCLLPCLSPFDYYHEDTGTCTPTCGSYSSIKDGQYFICLPMPGPKSTGLLPDILLNAPFDYKISFLSIVPLLEYIQYMDINFPPRLANLILSHNRPIFSLQSPWTIPGDLLKKFNLDSIPSVFSDLNLHSNFIVNYWKDMVSIWIILGISLFFFVVELVARIYGKRMIFKVCYCFRFFMFWNVLFVIFAQSISRIVLYGYLDFLNFDSNSMMVVVSRILAVCMLILILVFFYGNIYFSNNAKQAQDVDRPHKDTDVYDDFLSQYQSVQVLYKGYTGSRISFSHFFLTLYLIRIIAPTIVSASATTYPLFQAYFYLSMTAFIVLYVAIFKPLASKINQIQLLVIESIVLVMNIATLVLVYFDRAGRSTHLISIFTADIIIMGNVTINLLLLIFFIIKLAFKVRRAYRLRKLGSNHELSAWLNLLFIPIQQSGFGFLQAKAINLPSFAAPIFNKSKAQSSLVNNTKQTEWTIFGDPLPEKEKEKGIMDSTNIGLFGDEDANNVTALGQTRVETATSRKRYVPGSALKDLGLDHKPEDKLAHDMNEEIVSFTDPDVAEEPADLATIDPGLMTGVPRTPDTLQIRYPTVQGNAFPVQRIMNKREETPPFVVTQEKRKLHNEFRTSDSDRGAIKSAQKLWRAGSLENNMIPEEELDESPSNRRQRVQEEVYSALKSEKSFLMDQKEKERMERRDE